MQSGKKEILQQKLAALQLKLRTDDFIKKYGTEISNILAYLQSDSIDYQVVAIDNIADDLNPLIKERFNALPYADYGLNTANLNKESHQDRVLNHFPVVEISSVHYLPELDYIKPSEPDKSDYLRELTALKNLPCQPVYVYYFNLGLLLKVELHALSRGDEYMLFDEYNDNIVIHPEDFGWLAVFTSKYARRFGWRRYRGKNQKTTK